VQIASAQEQQGYASNHFQPAERGSRWFVLDSMDIRGKGRLVIGAVNDYSYRSLVHYHPWGTAAASMVRNQVLMHLGGSLTLADRVRIGLGVPVQPFADGRFAIIRGVGHQPTYAGAMGDIRFSVDARALGKATKGGALGLGVRVFVPSGPTTAYLGDGDVRIEPHVMLAGQSRRWAYAARAGVMLRDRQEPFGDGYIGHSVSLGLSAGVLLAKGKLLIGPEIFGSTVVSDDRYFDARTTPVEALMGAHLSVRRDMNLGLGAGMALTRGYGAPVARGLLTFEWVAGDVAIVRNKKSDGAPELAGPAIEKMQDASGSPQGAATSAPPPDEASKRARDRDDDGVPDSDDACGFVPGVASQAPAENGCPQPSAVPAPPATAPALPVAPAPVVAAPDADGDGIADDVDACPEQAGKVDENPKRNGCPTLSVQDAIKSISEQVKFRVGSAEILLDSRGSDPTLDAVLSALKSAPRDTVLLIEGHTDNVGTNTGNQVLSQARADAVAAWLVRRGIARERLVAKGYGATRPVDTNETDAGRKSNRRVEFRLESRK